jgi:hypothetical protein
MLGHLPIGLNKGWDAQTRANEVECPIAGSNARLFEPMASNANASADGPLEQRELCETVDEQWANANGKNV